MARLRELHEHPEWRWERDRRGSIRARIDDLRPAARRSLVPTGSTLQKQIDQIAIGGLPDTIQFAPGNLSICCRNMEHLVEQLVLIAKALDTDYQALQQQIESMPTRKPPGRAEHAARSALQAAEAQWKCSLSEIHHGPY
jgi:hypothetical protein